MLCYTLLSNFFAAACFLLVVPVYFLVFVEMHHVAGSFGERAL